MDTNDIAQTVRYFRKRSGLSQLELATIAGVGKTVVFDVEKGKKSIQLNSLLKILTVLNIKLTLETPFPQPKENQT